MNEDLTSETNATRHPLAHIADEQDCHALASVLADRYDSVIARGREALAGRTDIPRCSQPMECMPGILDAFMDILGAGSLDAVDAAFVRAVEAADPSLSLFDTAACLRHALGAIAQAALPTVLHERGFSDPDHRGLALLMAAADAGAARLHSTLTRTALREIAAEREQRMRFYQEVVRLATHDRLRLVEPHQLPSPLGSPLPLITALDASCLRHTALDLAQSSGMISMRAEDFALAVGEAASNVLKHAGGGMGRVWCDGEAVYAFLTDAGQGITMDLLPKALSPGWSSMPSLGMGFTLMMEMADVLWLSTSVHGTLLCIQQNVTAPRDAAQPALCLDDLASMEQ